jgi:hypothetical protein
METIYHKTVIYNRGEFILLGRWFILLIPVKCYPKMRRILLLLVLSLTMLSCSKEPIEESIVTVYMDINDPSKLYVDNTRYESKGLEFAYEIPNDGTDEYFVSIVRDEAEFTVHFSAAYNFDKLLLMQYDFKMTEESIPWEISQKDGHHYILRGPNEKLKKPATGYYKFVVIGYNN